MERPKIGAWEKERVTHPGVLWGQRKELCAYIRYLETAVDEAVIEESIEPLREIWDRIPRETSSK